jgi:hypothetical protein
LLKAAIISTFCLTLSAASCGEQKVVKALPIPAERIDCVPVAEQRPSLPPEHAIDWAKVKSVAQAKAEHEHFKHTVRQRNEIVSHYIVDVETMLFACSNDAQWLREREKELAR